MSKLNLIAVEEAVGVNDSDDYARTSGELCRGLLRGGCGGVVREGVSMWSN